MPLVPKAWVGRQNLLEWAAAAVSFITGQWLLVGFGQAVIGSLLSLAGIFLVLRRFWPRAPWLSNASGLGAAGLACAALAAWWLPTSPWLGLGLFILSGTLVMAANALAGSGRALANVPQQPVRLLGWEPWFLILLLLLGFYTRAFRLNEYPAGVCFHESVMADVCADLKHQPYTPHLSQDHANFPSLIFYQGLLMTKFFGWNPAAFRWPSAWWGIASLFIFYFLARRLAAPGAAAIATLLFTASGLQLAVSRWFFPGSMLFFSPLAAWLFLLLGLRRGRNLYFILAGAAVGLSLHGYFPGRVMPLILAGWLAWLWLTARTQFPSWRQMAWLAGGFFGMASPIMVYALVQPGYYWQSFLHSSNPDMAGGLLAYLKNTLPVYAQMFHLRSDFDYSLHLANQPLLDPVTGILFPLGLFASMLVFWQPMPAWMFMLLVGGLAPAIFGGIFQHPTVRRVLVALPAIYLFAAVGLERLRLAFNPQNQRWVNRLLLAAGLLAAGWAVHQTTREYFVNFCTHPGARVAYYYRIYAMGQQIRKYPNARVRLNPESGATSGWGVLLPQNSAQDRPNTLEALLVMNPQQDHLLLLNPVLEIYRPFFEKIFPQAQVQITRESRWYDPVCSQGYFMDANDPYNPLTYLVSIWIPKADIQHFQGLRNLDHPQEAPSEVWGAEFAQQHAGQHLRLAGAVILNQPTKVTTSVAWPGWKLSWDKTAGSREENTALNAGIHYLQWSGRVPPTARGPLPIRIRIPDKDLLAAGCLVALLPEMGVRTKIFSAKPETKDTLLQARQELFPEKRYYAMDNLPGEFTVCCEGWLTVPQTGDYTFTAKEFAFTRVSINGQVGFDNYAGRDKPKVKSISLKGGQPVRFVGQALMEVDMHARVFMVWYQGPGQKDPVPVPPEWIKPF